MLNVQLARIIVLLPVDHPSLILLVLIADPALLSSLRRPPPRTQTSRPSLSAPIVTFAITISTL